LEITKDEAAGALKPSGTVTDSTMKRVTGTRWFGAEP
jgi:hypothetical protein